MLNILSDRTVLNVVLESNFDKTLDRNDFIQDRVSW